MKIEVEITHRSGDVCRYPVNKLVRGNDGWTAHYTVVKNGRHEGRKTLVEIGKAALIVKTDYLPTVQVEKAEAEYCPDCKGTGHLKSHCDMPDPICPRCGGSGIKTEMEVDG